MYETESWEHSLLFGQITVLQWALGADFNYSGDIIDGIAYAASQPNQCKLPEYDKP
jgi:hypothetical protein